MGMNIAILTGRLTADPELKYTQSGKAFARFTVAVNRTYNREETDFINVVAWEKKAELAAEYLRKGSMVGIQGSIRVRKYEDENKQKRTITEILAENVEFLDSKKSKGTADNEPEYEPSQASSSVGDDEFPF